MRWVALALLISTPVSAIYVAPAGSGTVTSVALTLPAFITVSGSPVTASGTLTGAFATQTANTVLAGPVSGGAAQPTFRAPVAADIPNLDAAKITTGTLAFARGGTGATAFATSRIPFSNGTNFLSDGAFLWDNTNKRLALGNPGSARLSANVSSGSDIGIGVQCEGSNNCVQVRSNNAYNMALLTANDSNALGVLVGAERSRGTQTSRTQSMNGDLGLNLIGTCYTGSASSTGAIAAITYVQSENCTASANGGEIAFSTTPNTTTTAIERARFTNDGQAKFHYGMMIDTSTIQPTCDTAHRGLWWVVQGGAGVADVLQICLKNAADVYTWVTK